MRIKVASSSLHGASLAHAQVHALTSTVGAFLRPQAGSMKAESHEDEVEAPGTPLSAAVTGAHAALQNAPGSSTNACRADSSSACRPAAPDPAGLVWLAVLPTLTRLAAHLAHGGLQAKDGLVCGRAQIHKPVLQPCVLRAQGVHSYRPLQPHTRPSTEHLPHNVLTQQTWREPGCTDASCRAGGSGGQPALAGSTERGRASAARARTCRTTTASPLSAMSDSVRLASASSKGSGSARLMHRMPVTFISTWRRPATSP